MNKNKLNKKLIFSLICFFSVLIFASFIFYFLFNNSSNVPVKKEIEPNDTMEYAQFIDGSVLINGSFKSTNGNIDTDYYEINPTNGFIMDFYIKTSKKHHFEIDILNVFDESILNIKSRDVLNYNGKILIKGFLIKNNPYFIRLQSELLDKNKPVKYDISITFTSEYPILNEIEPNDNFKNSDRIISFDKPVQGYFIKKNIVLDEKIRDYIDPGNIVDIDIYKIINPTDIDSVIEIVMNYDYIKDTGMLLFDKDFNFIKRSIGKIETDFNAQSEYYIALYLKGDKSILSTYTISYMLKK